MSMTMEWIRSMMTVITFATFVGIVLWAWSARKRNDFDAASRSILVEDDSSPRGQAAVLGKGCRDE